VLRTLVVASTVFLVASDVALLPGERAARRPPVPAAVAVTLDRLRPAAEVDPRFLSFAVDIAQVVGGDFWAPPGSGQGLLQTQAVARYDFGRARLRRLTGALAPAYLRIGGTDADRTAYDVGQGEIQTGTGSAPSPGATGARWRLSRRSWDAVGGFARDLGLSIMFTLNAGPSARDERGEWNPDSARALVAYTRRQGYPVEVWELGNEVNAFPLTHRMWLSADRYARDLGRARVLLDDVDPGTRLAGPSSAYWPVVGEGRSFSEAVLRRAGPLLDVVSWHYYPQQSHRCPLAVRRAAAEHTLSGERLDEVERWAGQIESAARTHAPRAAVWLGETGSAQCGGEPGLSNAFVDALWWLDELGRLARRGQPVVVRQTLSGSDYGLIDDETLEPNPSYWASWLWRRLMGTRALGVHAAPAPGALGLYAHCARAGSDGDSDGDAGGGAGRGAAVLLLVNGDPSVKVSITLPGLDRHGARFLRLTADGLGARKVRLNGVPLQAGADGSPPPLAPLLADVDVEVPLSLPPLSATFVVLPAAMAPACSVL
jgi:hypothetical protein